MGRPYIEFLFGQPKTDPKDHKKAIKELQRAVAEISKYQWDRVYRDVKTKSAAYTMDAIMDRIILVDTTSGSVTITLPNPSDADHTEYTIVKLVAGNTLTVDGGDGNINGSATVAATTQYACVTVASDGTNYFRTDLD